MNSLKLILVSIITVLLNINESQPINSCNKQSSCFDVELRNQGETGEELLCLIFSPCKEGCSKCGDEEAKCDWTPQISFGCTRDEGSKISPFCAGNDNALCKSVDTFGCTEPVRARFQIQDDGNKCHDSPFIQKYQFGRCVNHDSSGFPGDLCEDGGKKGCLWFVTSRCDEGMKHISANEDIYDIDLNEEVLMDDEVLLDQEVYMMNNKKFDINLVILIVGIVAIALLFGVGFALCLYNRCHKLNETKFL